MTKWAKLVDTKFGQVVVLNTFDNEGDYEVRVMAKYDDVSLTVGFTFASEEGDEEDQARVATEALFHSLDAERLEEVVGDIYDRHAAEPVIDLLAKNDMLQ